jgi:hypothetical protein
MLYFSMLPVLSRLALVLNAGFASPRPAIIDPVCVTQSDTVRPHLEAFQWIVANSPPAILSDISLPSKPAGGVTVVADEAVCSQSLTAINGRLVGADTSLAATRVIVLRVGAERYVITHATSPTQPGWRSWYIYTTSFQFLHGMSGP